MKFEVVLFEKNFTMDQILKLKDSCPLSPLPTFSFSHLPNWRFVFTMKNSSYIRKISSPQIFEVFTFLSKMLPTTNSRYCC